MPPPKSGQVVSDVICAMISERRDFTPVEQSNMVKSLLEDGLNLDEIRALFPWIIREQPFGYWSNWTPTVTTYYTSNLD